jgi:hypothetical protein
MRWSRRYLVVVAALAAAVGLPAGSSAPAASAQTFLTLRSIDCSGVTVSAAGLPRSSVLTITLSAPDKRPLQHQRVTTSPSGTLVWSARVSLSGLRSVRAAVSRPGASAPIAWTEHSVPTPCPLVNTGANRAAPLAALALTWIALGLLLLTTFSYKGRHVRAYRGRFAPGFIHVGGARSPHGPPRAPVP